jgi:hypothetical protein
VRNGSDWGTNEPSLFDFEQVFGFAGAQRRARHFKPAERRQKKLLKEAGGSIDWTRVRRIASIKSTHWDTVSQPPFGRLTLELWEWTAGSILELSTSVGPNSGQPSYADLVRLVNAKELSISASQGAKTRMVLESFAGHVTH